MVLESFISPRDARKNIWSLFFLGMIYSSVAILLALIVFPNQASIASIFLTTLATAPLFVLLLKDEEALNIHLIEQKIPVFRNNLNILGLFFFIFLGFTISFSLWFTFLPEHELNQVFSQQITDIGNIQSMISGDFLQDTMFWPILQNNLRVMFFCVLFSFIYGAGAILILCWNASVLGTAVGLFIREKLNHSFDIASYLTSLPYGLGQYMVHGIFELFAYFMACLAGGIISASIVRKSYKRRSFFKLIKNTTLLLAGGLVVLIIAAFVEVTV